MTVRPTARPTTTARDLQIAGLVPLSTVDWPAKLVATVFCQGCPWRCFYCHNTQILDPKTAGSVEFSQLEGLLERRRGLLDGVVFSGGEATRQSALLPAAKFVAEAGYGVGLHTGGMYPARVKALLEADVLDWVGFDLKADPARYTEVVGAPTTWRKIQKSVELVVASGVDHEVRMTVTPEIANQVSTVVAVAQDLGVRSFALQQARPPATSAPDSQQSWISPEWDTRFEELTQLVMARGFASVTIRRR